MNIDIDENKYKKPLSEMSEKERNDWFEKLGEIVEEYPIGSPPIAVPINPRDENEDER